MLEQHHDVDETTNGELPQDRYKLSYSLMVLIGAGFLFPYNAFITAVDYFSYLFPAHQIEYAIPAVYTSCLFLTMLVLVKYGRHYTFHGRILGGFVCFFVVMSLVPVLDFINLADEKMFWITLGLVLVTGVGDAIVQGSMYGMASLFPPLYAQAIQNGNGIAGVIASLLRIVTKASLPETTEGLRVSTHIYFIISAFIMLLCLLSYCVLVRLPFAKYHLEFKNPQPDLELSTLGKELLSDPRDMLVLEDEVVNTRMVLYKIWKMGFGVSFVFFVTLLGYPGMVTDIPAPTIRADWFPIVLITVFNCFDLLGKMLPLKWDWKFGDKWLYLCTLFRIIFIPLFMFCIRMKALQEEVIPVIIVALFAVSNGYLGALMMMNGPTKVSPPEKEVAGNMMAFFLISGLALGSAVSYLVSPYVL